MLVRKSRMAEESDGRGKAIIEAFGPMPSVEDDAAATRALEGVRLSFRMPEELHRRLKLESCRRGKTIKGTIEGWVREMTPEA
jgi:hypothetical protein